MSMLTHVLSSVLSFLLLTRCKVIGNDMQIVCESEVNNFIIIVCNYRNVCFFSLCGKQIMMMMMMYSQDTKRSLSCT